MGETQNVEIRTEEEVEPFSTNEITFYPPQKLDTMDTPLSSGEAGTLSYYAPWDDVVMFYDYCSPNGSLYGSEKQANDINTYSRCVRHSIRLMCLRH